MKQIILAAAATVLLSTSATAMNISFPMPNLTFPPAPDVTTTKNCLNFDATSPTCEPKE